MSVYDLANRIARQIKKSDEYKEYLKKREKVVSNEKTKEMLLDFQQEQMKLQAKQLSGEDLSEEEKEKLENLRELVELNSNLKQYLQAEYKVNVMLNDIQKIVFGDLDLGIEPEKENND
ncbi:MAG: YlbF family regulator [Halanaerobiales bacterium]|nr:YlbF family regulator [Halanaerobiales bacterium]